MQVLRWLTACVLVCAAFSASPAAAQDDPAAVIELDYKPTSRAQVAIWIEDAQGEFLATVRLTEAVAYRGIGNRPGASQMNSGYRWPYGRREGVLPVWATRRAAATGARAFKRVVFQDRVEGRASRTTSDQSPDDYFCLSFTKGNSSRDALDAVSCASVFTSDKGRFMNGSDVTGDYAEPYEAIGTRAASRAVMPGTSLYPPRMDVNRCTTSGCYDSADLADFADHARDVMPEIDAVTMATPPGDTKQQVLFTIPSSWPSGNYVAWLEINVEGDYNSSHGPSSYPTPTAPNGDWDSWAMDYGYAYRGQPSVVFSVPFTLGEVGDGSFSTDAPVGRSSWDVWANDFGSMSPMSTITDDPSGTPGSGSDRLRADSDGHRVVVKTNVLSELPDPDEEPVDGGTTDPGDPTGEGGSGGSVNEGGAGSTGGGNQGNAGSGAANGGGGDDEDDPSKGVIIDDTGGGVNGPVGPVFDLELSRHGDELRAHTWIKLRFRAVESKEPLNSYDVRVATEAIVDEATFIRNGRQAKNATDDAEGATLLMLPTKARAGSIIEDSIGDLVAETRYYIGIRATDRFNRHGPISVAQITTSKRRFATVTPCFIATAAYGTPLAAEVGVLRQVRDRYLMPHAVGRALVSAYYAVGPQLATIVREHETVADAARAMLSPVVAFSRRMLTRE